MENIIHFLFTGMLISRSIFKMFVSLFFSAVKWDVCRHALLMLAASSRKPRENDETMSGLEEGKVHMSCFIIIVLLITNTESVN